MNGEREFSVFGEEREFFCFDKSEKPSSEKEKFQLNSAELCMNHASAIAIAKSQAIEIPWYAMVSVSGVF